MPSVTVTPSVNLSAAVLSVLRKVPREMEKGMILAVNETVRRSKAYGLALGNKAYTISPQARRRLAAQVSIRKMAKGLTAGELVFTGKPGAPLRWFKTRPSRPNPDKWSGSNRRRKNQDVFVQVKKAGAARKATGPNGERVFWMKGRSGNVVLVYRKANGKISNEGLMAASPIQAINRRDNAEKLAAYVADTLNKRVGHHIARILEGK